MEGREPEDGEILDLNIPKKDVELLKSALGRKFLKLTNYIQNGYPVRTDLGFSGNLTLSLTLEERYNNTHIFRIRELPVPPEDPDVHIDDVDLEPVMLRSVEIVNDHVTVKRNGRIHLEAFSDFALIVRADNNPVLTFWADCLTGNGFFYISKDRSISELAPSDRTAFVYNTCDELSGRISTAVDRTSRIFESRTSFKYPTRDSIAIETDDFGWFTDRGIGEYVRQDFEPAVEDYRLAAAMGDPSAVSDLGYCYLYGNGVKRDAARAFLYFQLAAKFEVVDALYKLGTFYENGVYVHKDTGVADDYYDRAFRSAEKRRLLHGSASLLLAVAKQKMPGGRRRTDIEDAYALLSEARSSFAGSIMAGAGFYQEHLDEVKELLKSPCFAALTKEKKKELELRYEDAAPEEREK